MWQVQPVAPLVTRRPLAASPRGRPNVTATPYAVWADAPFATVTNALNGPPAAPLPRPACTLTAL